MRTNLPVTQREHRLPADTTLVSVTDTKGRIVYCNPAFVQASGFAREELLGQPHNIVRHPDMPAEAFRDMWATIGADRPWSALVKNRRKDGDHYWVRANATPVRTDGRTVGYLSVRTIPSRAEIDAAESLYASLRAEADSGRRRHGLRAGRVVRADPLGRAGHWLRTLPRRFGLRSVITLVLAAGAGAAVTLLPAAAGWPVAAALAALAAALFHHLETARLRHLLDDVLQLAAGDLTHEVRRSRSGVIGDLQLALSQVAINLRSVALDVQVESSTVRGAADEIAVGNADLSARTEAQASSLQQTAASMEQISGTMRHSAESAREGTRLANDAATAAQHSHEAVLGVVQAMEAINESSRRIGEFVGLIEGVAFQTNILALNAAVEAARAGEQGRGFAIVASEVRSLAHRTADAAREIKALIAESSERVALGRTQTADAHTRMEHALAIVGNVSQLLGEIGTAAGEQQLGVAQINEAVADLDSITQQNAAMVEQLAAATKSLVDQALMVDSSMSLFRFKAGARSVAETDAVALRRDTQTSTSGPVKAFEPKDAIAAHTQWKARLRNAALRGDTIDADKAARDDCCALGQWLRDDGQRRWGRHPRFSELMANHANFHREAGAIARLLNNGQRDEAIAKLAGGGTFAKTSQATLMSIRALQTDIDHDVSAPAAASAPPAARPGPPVGRASAEPAATEEAWTAF